jgi:hypothetical protein
MKINISSFIRIVPIVILLSILILYAYNRSRNLIWGPKIVIDSPKSGETFSNDLLALKGTVANASEIFLNDRQIFVDENGDFSEELLLHYGYNIIEISAIDRFGHKKEHILQVVYQ